MYGEDILMQKLSYYLIGAYVIKKFSFCLMFTGGINGSTKVVMQPFMNLNNCE